MRSKSSNYLKTNFSGIRKFLQTYAILLILFSINSNVVLANQVNREQMTMGNSDNWGSSINIEKQIYKNGQTQLAAFSIYLPLILNGLPAPSPFNKYAPASGSSSVSLSPILSWTASTNASKYEYCYDTTNDNTCSNWISTGTNNYAGLSGLQANTTFYWQVRSWNGTYGPTYANGSASSYWSFMTENLSPGAFNKNAPASGSTGVSLSPILSWYTSTNATKYEYCYDTTNDNTCSNWISTGTNNYAGLSGLQENTTYYWQVRSWNGTYGPSYANGSSSAYWGFTTTTTIQNPIINGDFEQGLTGWTEYSRNDRDIIQDISENIIGFPPPSGVWAAEFRTREDNEYAYISQTVFIPTGRSTLHY